MEWINVKDRLPDNNTYIIVFLMILFGQPKVSLFYDDSFFVSDEDVTKWITHWMPLPEPPKE